MNLEDLQEDDVVDLSLSKRREQKQKEDQPVSFDEALDNIDETIELTITYLADQGMTEEEARVLVINRLSDIVMGQDLIS